jgi:hypothetical protein
MHVIRDEEQAAARPYTVVTAEELNDLANAEPGRRDSREPTEL